MPSQKSIDIVNFAADGDKVNFNRTVQDSLNHLAVDSIESKKIEVATNMFVGSEESDD